MKDKTIKRICQQRKQNWANSIKSIKKSINKTLGKSFIQGTYKILRIPFSH
ncbi:hypothetical protein PPHE_a2349 [Pseudoalteromonas phenolica O-BC30]|nr:hypothetical protein [Pseudoalteromonas phenolica O-BC30]